MGISLQKGQSIDLRKKATGGEYNLSSVTIGLGWDVRKKGNFFSNLPGSSDEYDLDAIAFLLNANGKVADRGRMVRQTGRDINLFGGDIIYFNSLKHPSGNIWLTGDNRTGEGEGDDEQIIVKLDQLDQKYQKILFLVTIYRGERNQQHFGMVENAFIRAVDHNGVEIAKFSLSGNKTLEQMHGMIFAEIYRSEGTWKFRAIGEPKTTDNFVHILKDYL